MSAPFQRCLGIESLPLGQERVRHSEVDVRRVIEQGERTLCCMRRAGSESEVLVSLSAVALVAKTGAQGYDNPGPPAEAAGGVQCKDAQGQLKRLAWRIEANANRDLPSRVLSQLPPGEGQTRAASPGIRQSRPSPTSVYGATCLNDTFAVSTSSSTL